MNANKRKRPRTCLLALLGALSCAAPRVPAGPPAAAQPELLPEREAQSASRGDAQPEEAGSDPEEEWRWVQTRFPEVNGFETPSNRVDELLAWATPSAVLFDRRCRPIRVERRGDTLVGRINEQTSVQGTTRTRSFETLLIGERIHVTCGTVQIHEREGNEWVETGEGGLGCIDPVGHLLSRIESDAAWFNGIPVRLSMGCVRQVETTFACANAPRTCRSCIEWGVHPSSMEHGVGMGRHVPVVQTQGDPAEGCGQPCPEDEVPDEVRRAQDALERRTFVDEGPAAHPFLFRTRVACQNYRRAHSISPEDARPW